MTKLYKKKKTTPLLSIFIYYFIDIRFLFKKNATSEFSTCLVRVLSKSHSIYHPYCILILLTEQLYIKRFLLSCWLMVFLKGKYA